MEKEVKKNRKNNSVNKKLKTALLVIFGLAATGSTIVMAWFSLTNQAQVSSLSIKAGTSGGLLIGTSANDVTHDSVSLSTTDANGNSYCVKPITSDNGADFYLPVYSEEGVVTSVSAQKARIADISNKTEANSGYMLTYTVYLLAQSKNLSGDVGIRLASEEADKDHDGTYVKAKTNADNGAQASMRMSFTANGTTTVYEPNANMNVTGSSDTQYKKTSWTNLKTLKQTAADSGLFYDRPSLPGANATYTEKSSPELFKIQVNKVTPVTINIWLEGSDKDCINDVMADNMLCNIQFICTDLE